MRKKTIDRSQMWIYYEDGKFYAVNRRGVPCVFCGLLHHHGVGDGHRQPHCPGSGIEFQVGEITLNNLDGYIWKEDLDGRENSRRTTHPGKFYKCKCGKNHLDCGGQL